MSFIQVIVSIGTNLTYLTYVYFHREIFVKFIVINISKLFLYKNILFIVTNILVHIQLHSN